jgi:hypothetical protein
VRQPLRLRQRFETAFFEKRGQAAVDLAEQLDAARVDAAAVPTASAPAMIN